MGSIEKKKVQWDLGLARRKMATSGPTKSPHTPQKAVPKCWRAGESNSKNSLAKMIILQVTSLLGYAVRITTHKGGYIAGAPAPGLDKPWVYYMPPGILNAPRYIK